MSGSRAVLKSVIQNSVRHPLSVMPTGRRYKIGVLSDILKTDFVVRFKILFKERLISNWAIAKVVYEKPPAPREPEVVVSG